MHENCFHLSIMIQCNCLKTNSKIPQSETFLPVRSVSVLFNWSFLSSSSSRWMFLHSGIKLSSWTSVFRGGPLIWGGFSRFSSSLLKLGFHRHFFPALLWVPVQTVKHLTGSSWSLFITWAFEKETCFSLLLHSDFFSFFFLFFYFTCCYLVLLHLWSLKTWWSFKKKHAVRFWCILCEADLSENCFKEMKAQKAVIHKNIKVSFYFIPFHFLRIHGSVVWGENLTWKHNIKFIFLVLLLYCIYNTIIYNHSFKYAFMNTYYLYMFIHKYN